MLECASVITDAHGNAVKVPASNRFVIPRGFVGTWEVVETRKIHVIHGHGEWRNAIRGAHCIRSPEAPFDAAAGRVVSEARPYPFWPLNTAR